MLLSLMTTMSQEDQQDVFTIELDKLIERFVEEFDLTITSAIGVLEKAKLDLYISQAAEDPEDE